jgi:hypothetical protein
MNENKPVVVDSILSVREGKASAALAAEDLKKEDPSKEKVLARLRGETPKGSNP